MCKIFNSNKVIQKRIWDTYHQETAQHRDDYTKLHFRVLFVVSISREIQQLFSSLRSSAAQTPLNTNLHPGFNFCYQARAVKASFLCVKISNIYLAIPYLKLLAFYSLKFQSQIS